MPGASQITREQMRARLVRYGELVPCRTAFIDTRTPGSEEKENFTIIGPGVAENPDQHVHIREPHGFNIGAARPAARMRELPAQPRDRRGLLDPFGAGGVS